MKQTERPHPLTPFVRGWLVLVALVLGLGRSVLEQLGGNRDDGFDLADVGWLLPVGGGVVLLAAVAGFVSWRFTRFVIDDEELRVETGAIFKNSRRVAFERVQSVDLVQPLAARLFGLAELRIEVGAGGNGVVLRYLTRGKASRLRDYLVARAAGERATIAETSGQEQASAFTDRSSAEKPIVTLSPAQLVGGFLISSDWLASALFVIAGFVVSGVFGAVVYALPGLVPLAVGALTLISRRVIAQFNYTLSESPRGLRVSRGLTNLSSQSVPIARVQGIRVSQSLLWRRFGWYRIDVDVLGVGRRDQNENGSGNGDLSAMLLPVATSAQTRLALSRVLPGVDFDRLELQPSPKRCRWLRPLDGWTLRWAVTDQVVVAEHGFLIKVRNIVPHGKTQSVRVEQGPLQRRLRLADLHVDTPRGPVTLVAQHLDPAVARELALGQLDRARTARATPASPSPSPSANLSSSPIRPPQADAEVLAHFGLDGVTPLGSGGEATVYPLDADRVLRVYRSDADSAALPQLARLRDLYATWGGVELPFQVPRMIELDQVAGRPVSIDRRMTGTELTAVLRSAETNQRRTILLRYLDAAQQLQRLPLPAPGFGRLLGPEPAPYDTLFALLDDQLRAGWRRCGARLERDLPDATGMITRLRDDLAQREAEPRLVHGDYFPANVFAGPDRAGAVMITGVGDFSPHTLAADPMMDVAGAVVLMELSYPEAPADASWLGAAAVERLGGETGHWIEVYRRFYCVYYGDDPEVYPWALATLRNG